MSRSLIALALLTACTGSDTLHLNHMSTMQSQTRGVVLYDDGQRGHAAMQWTTCEFDTLNGWLISDHDLPTETEVVQDQLDNVVLGRSDEGVHFVQDPDRDLSLARTVQARLQDDGTAAILRHDAVDGCVADFGDQVVPVGQALCQEDARVDTDRDGTLYVATGQKLVAVSRDGTTTLDDGVDLVVYDRSVDMVYTTRSGDTELRGLDTSGTVQWRAETLGPIHALSHMGRRGLALVMVEDPDTGHGALQAYEGYSGELMVHHQTPTGDGEITVSEDGTTLAVTLPNEVYFYDVSAEGETSKERKTLGDPDPVFSD